MRFAGEIEYVVTDNATIEAALSDFTKKTIEAIPTTGDSEWVLKVYFEAVEQ